MGWMQKLYETYENSTPEIGRGLGNPTVTPLLPVSHTTQNAQIEICIDGEGNLVRGSSRVITDKKDQITIIPCTEDSASRASGPAPHPLYDKLQYIAKDYLSYGGKQKAYHYEMYMEGLNRWCSSPAAHHKVKAIRDYLQKGTLITDLVQEGILPADPGGRVPEKWTGEKDAQPAIYKVVASPLDAFVRIRVQIPGDALDCPWQDRTVWDSYIAYDASFAGDTRLCYVRGEELPASEKSPAKLRHTGDKAKLISSNDSSGFTYRGRFATAGEAVSLSYDASQKAHNALKWLIARQGIRQGDQVYVAWGTRGEELPDFAADTADLGLSMGEEGFTGTREDFARRLGAVMAGYRKNLDDHSDIIIMGVDSATIGRLSIIYYREMTGTDFLDRLAYWHSTCTWLHTYKSDYSQGKKPQHITFEGAPAPKDIALAAYGQNAGDKLVKAAVERLVPCILDKAPLPEDMVRSAARRAGNPVSMERWEYHKVLSIACALIKKRYNDQYNRAQHPHGESYEEVWKMPLDKETSDRSYLFGRLLAYAQNLESYAMYVSDGAARQTNAERMMHQFSLKPRRTWGILTNQLVYYKKRLGQNALSHRLQTEMNALLDRIGPAGFTDQKLSETYLLGYASQMNEFENEKALAREKKGEKA